MERKIDFVIGGAQKAGTTALYEYLKEHQNIYMPDIKELHFFDTSNYEISNNYSKYNSKFSDAQSYQVLGEATPIYMYWNPCPKRIKIYNPKMKWIICLRNPIERAFSQWNMQYVRQKDNLQFLETLQLELKKARIFPSLQNRRFSYISRGMYCSQIERLWKLFGEQNVLIIRTEELLGYPNKVLKNVYQFLNLKESKQVEKKEVFKIPYIRSILPEEKDLLLGIYEQEIDRLEHMLGWNCENWKV
jgi:hypothetical protein